MRILVDIGHPAHVHYYRNLAIELDLKGHKVFWTVKRGSSAMEMLQIYGFEFKTLPKKRDSLIIKILLQVVFDLILLTYCIKHKIKIAIGTSVTIAHISKIMKLKSIVFDDDDDDVQPLVTEYVQPYADALLSPDCLRGKRKRHDTVYYPGYHELAYLHPKRFKPDPSVIADAGLTLGETFFIMRFNVFKAHHDIGISGLSLEQKLTLIKILNSFGKVLITTERSIEPELESYRLIINPEKIHSLLYYSRLFIGDSQTMTSEAAVLGVPSFRCNSFAGRISYLEEQEKKYGLTYAYLPENFDCLLIKLQELLNQKDLRKEWHQRRKRMLDDKIDVTAFWLWFVENFPESKKIVLTNTHYPERFK